MNIEKIKSKCVVHLVKVAKRFDRPLSIDEFMKHGLAGFPSQNAKGMLPWMLRHSKGVFVQA